LFTKSPPFLVEDYLEHFEELHESRVVLGAIDDLPQIVEGHILPADLEDAVEGHVGLHFFQHLGVVVVLLGLPQD